MAMGRVPQLGFALAGAVVVLDQATKWLIANVVHMPMFCDKCIAVVPPIFYLSHVENTGVSFGLLNSDTLWGRIGLIVFALAISGLFARWLMKTDRLWPGVSMGLVIGGALGNVIDRIVHGRVFDFLDFSRLGFPWIFNVADSAITIGMIMLAWDAFFANRKPAPPESSV